MFVYNKFGVMKVLMYTALLFLLASCGGGGSGDPAPVNETVDPLAPQQENYINIAAISGPIVAVRVGEVAILDGSNSYAASEQGMAYSWSFTHRPAGSTATLQAPTSANPSFIADVRGVYIIELVVSAEGIQSLRAVNTVIVTNPGERLTGPFNHPGLSSNCVNCHDGMTSKASGGLLPHKSPNHFGSSNTCQACHTPQGFNIIPVVDHDEVFGNCSDCHNGVIAIGKSAFHVETTGECDDCHNTSSFLDLLPDGSFDHSNIQRSCNGCHNGQVATGQTPTTADSPPGTHPVTNAECGYCHTTQTFLNAYPDHTGPVVTGTTCNSCHVADGSGPAQGHSPAHPVSTLDCDSCHSITAFQLPGGLFNHNALDSSQQSCESCHNDATSVAINRPNVKLTKSDAVPTHPVTTSDCSVCHSTDSFFPAYGVDHSVFYTDPVNFVLDPTAPRCDSCHDGNTATGIPLSTPFYAHMPTGGDDCSACHTPGTFASGTYDHAGVTTGCNACHDNRISIGKLLNHIPTTPDTQDCADCHNTTAFLPALFTHAGITNNCESCHDGNISTGKPVTHVPTTQDCVTCHSTAAPFAPAVNFAHTGITGNCQSCHDGSASNALVGAVGKGVDHIPSQNDCDVCHLSTNTGGFANNATFLNTVHNSITSGCEGCHTSRFIPSNPNALKAATHLPTAQDCNVCHVVAAFKPSVFSHNGIATNCQSCHDGSANHVAVGALGKAQATNPHPQTTSDCNTCHAIGNNFTDGTFDHTGITSNCSSCHGDNPTATPTGPRKNPGHVPTTQDCSLCHVPGTFLNATFDHTGIVDNCSSCHAGANAVGRVKPVTHVPTTQDCVLCHNTTTFAGARFDHTGITNNCVQCHDGVTARGKTPPPNHVPTNGDCVDCHQTTGFKPATFSHVGIVDNCQSCHDGKFAIGKSANHVPTNQDCSVCHTTTSFVGAGFNHTGIVDNCESCHDGTTAIGKEAKTNPSHWLTSLDCHHCHTTATFLGGTWIHDNTTTGRCSDCHSNSGGATIKPNGHISTTVQCDVCHTTNGWTPVNFSHDPNGDYPGDHRRAPGCNACHGNSIDLPFNYPFNQYAPDCAACHANQFKRKGDHIGGENGTVSQNRNCGSSGCHRVRDKEF